MIFDLNMMRCGRSPSPHIALCPAAENLLDNCNQGFYYTYVQRLFVQQLPSARTERMPDRSTDMAERFARFLTAISTTYLLVRISMGLLA